MTQITTMQMNMAMMCGMMMDMCRMFVCNQFLRIQKTGYDLHGC